LRGVSGAGTWPQVFIGGKLIGTADDVEKYFKAARQAR
jgi:glutathione-dependent peroxiredoxin